MHSDFPHPVNEKSDRPSIILKNKAKCMGSVVTEMWKHIGDQTADKTIEIICET